MTLPQSSSGIAGMLLEEVVAWLLSNSGYRLLTTAPAKGAPTDTDDVYSDAGGMTLRVRGRGTDHQVDALGEFSITPPFTLPTRLFVEAKCYSKKVGIDVVRNGMGTVSDVNQYWRNGAPRRRRAYRYAIFSTSGFSAHAQQYAMAHDINLVDLKVPTFQPLIGLIEDVANRLLQAARLRRLQNFPMDAVRRITRSALRSVGDGQRAKEEGDAAFLSDARQIVGSLGTDIVRNFGRPLAGFSAAGDVVLVTSPDIEAFVRRSLQDPGHAATAEVQQPAGEGTGAELWTIRPVRSNRAGDAEQEEYELNIPLPPTLAEAIADVSEDRTASPLGVQELLGGTLSVYFAPDKESFLGAQFPKIADGLGVILTVSLRPPSERRKRKLRDQSDD